MGDKATKRPSRADIIWAAATFGALALSMTVLVSIEAYTRDKWPESSGNYNSYKNILYFVSVGLTCLVGGGFILRRLRIWQHPRAKLVLRILSSVVLVVVGSFYFFGVRGYARAYPYVHTHDTYHYLLGPKYYREIGYFDLYECTVEAHPDAFNKNTKITDLRTTKRRKIGNIKREGPSCEERMGPERFAEFQRDLDVWVEMRGKSAIRGPTHDLGFNGTPTLSTLGYGIANTVPLTYESLHFYTLLDVYLVCALLAVVVLVFGWEIGTLFAFFIFINPADRFSVVGGSYLRYAWFAALVFGLASLERGRHIAAGAWLATATLLAVHPAVFIFGVLTQGIAGWIRTKTFPKHLAKFIAAGVLTTFVLGGLSMIPRGPKAWGEFAEDMKVHSATTRLAGYGTGYKFLYLYRGGHKQGQGMKNWRKKKQFPRVKPLYRTTGLLLIGFAILASLSAEPAESSMLVGFTTMFCVLETTGYYFLSAGFLVLLWYRRLHCTGPPAIILALFTMTAASLYGYAAGASTFHLYNHLCSATWFVTMLACIAYMGSRTSGFPNLFALLFKPAPKPEGAAEHDVDDEAQTAGRRPARASTG